MIAKYRARVAALRAELAAAGGSHDDEYDRQQPATISESPGVHRTTFGHCYQVTSCASADTVGIVVQAAAKLSVHSVWLMTCDNVLQGRRQCRTLHLVRSRTAWASAAR